MSVSTSSSVEPKIETVAINPPKKSLKSPDDMPIDYGNTTRDEESLPDVKEAQCLDPYGNEEGAKVKCRFPELPIGNSC